jgi:ABC-type dipeptide/oligopeptide/nickel transport system permease component
MTRYILGRLLSMTPVLTLVLVIVFALTRLIPGDPATTLLGPGATTAQIEALRHQLHLDQPPSTQFLSYVWGLLHGDLGVSLKTGRPVIEELAAKLPATLELSVVALAMAIAIGVPAGVHAALRPNSWTDQGLRLLALVGVSAPAFLIAFALQGLFGAWLQILPVAGRTTPYLVSRPITGFAIPDALLRGSPADLLDAVRHILLPAAVLAAFLAATLSRFVRGAMIEAMAEDYIRTARAKGLREPAVIYGHGLRNAMLPAIAVAGLQFGDMLGGAILTETVFSWPGVGRYTYEAIRNRDYPVIQSATLTFALLFMLTSLLADLISAALDPRLRERGR